MPSCSWPGRIVCSLLGRHYGALSRHGAVHFSSDKGKRPPRAYPKSPRLTWIYQVLSSFFSSKYCARNGEVCVTSCLLSNRWPTFFSFFFIFSLAIVIGCEEIKRLKGGKFPPASPFNGGR